MQLNGYDLEVLPVALADRIGLADLFGGGQGASLRKGWGGMASTYSTTVPIHTLDGLLADRTSDQQLLVKIDAEGGELPILQGAKRMLAANAAWIIEVGLTENFDGVNPDYAPIFELMWSAGYKAQCVEATGRSVSPSDVRSWVANGDRGFWKINYLFTRY